MIKVGITGGIGSGKSTVAHFYELMGYPVYHADRQAKNIANSKAEVKKQLVATFGEHIYNKELNRAALAKIVFSNESALKKLNAIIHPAVERDFENWCKKQKTPLVFKEAAILFESGTDTSVDKIICVTAPKELRIARVMKRDKTNPQEVKARISKQWAEERKAQLSDFILLADDKEPLIPQLIKVLKKLTNLR